MPLAHVYLLPTLRLRLATAGHAEDLGERDVDLLEIALELRVREHRSAQRRSPPTLARARARDRPRPIARFHGSTRRYASASSPWSALRQVRRTAEVRMSRSRAPA